MPDTALVLARNLKQVTEPLVTSRPVFSGQVTEAESGVCQLEAGLLLSRPLVDSMLADMEWCYRWTPALMTNSIFIKYQITCLPETRSATTSHSTFKIASFIHLR